MEEEKKKEIGIVADEGGDLKEEFIEKYQIGIVPFKVDLLEMEKIEGDIYQKIRKSEEMGKKIFIKTSQPSPGDFLLKFKEYLKKFEKIICITITSKHSGTYNSALQAKNFLEPNLKERVEVIDSLSGSVGEGLIILKAVKLIEEKLNFDQIIKKLKETISKTNLIFILETPERLQSSGRIPHFLGNWLKKMAQFGIRPVLGVKNGKIRPIGIKRGAKDIVSGLYKEFEQRIFKIKEKKGKIKVAIAHADVLEKAEELKEKIEKLKDVEVVYINLIGNILGGLVGPGAIALAWQYD